MRKENYQNIIFLINGIVVNVNKAIKIKKKSFSGININGYNIKIPEKYKKQNFSDTEAYESTVYCKTQFQNVINKLKEDNIEILSLIGNKGVIDEKEYKNLK